MNYFIYVLYAIILIAMVGCMIASDINSRKKARLKIDHAFAKPPLDEGFIMSSIESFHLQQETTHHTSLWIDDTTWDDLEMDLIFKRISNCCSSVGEEYLYHVLHKQCFDQSTLDAREPLIDFFTKHPDVRLDTQAMLARLGKAKNNGLASLMNKGFLKPLRHPFIYKVLACLPLAGLVMLPFSLVAGLLVIVATLIINMLVYYISKSKIEYDLLALNYFSAMLHCCDTLCKTLALTPFIADLEKYYAVFKPLRSKIPMASALKGSASEADFFVEYLRILFLIDLRNFNKSTIAINENTATLEKLFEALGEFDLCISILSYRQSMYLYCKPTFHEANEVSFSGLYHPLLNEPITNDAVINNNSIITGSNASGKSTFIKAVAINGILAQTINTCAAESYNTRLTLVITSMAARDNISNGDSYFITEIKSLKRILDKVIHTHCCCFIDEILKGTNTVERIAASTAVLQHLHHQNCLCIVASHDIELTQILSDQYENYHFREQITDDGICFDYLIKQGASKTRNAIKLLHFMNFDSDLVENAENLVDNFMTNHKW